MGLFLDKNQVGLYVDSETITVVSGQVKASTVTVTGFAEIRVPTLLDSGPESRQKILNDIRTAFTRAGVKSKSVSISVPGDGSMTRHFELPVLPKKEERGAVRFEAQKYVPFEAKSLYYDYETYFDEERKRSRVVYFACKKQWVDSLSALLTLAGVKISQVELVSQSVARAFQRHAAKKADEISLVVVCNDQNTAELIVQKGGSVLTTRHIALSRTPDGSALDIPMFVSDVRISLDYFSENFKDIKVQRLFLVTPFSGEATMVSEALQKELLIPADCGTLFQPPGPAVSTTAAVAAYGLTIGAIEKKTARRVSLKPTEAASTAPIITWEEEKKQLQDLATKEIIGIAVVLVIAYFFMANVTGSKKNELQKTIESYPVAQSASLNESLADLQSKQAATAKKINFFNTLVEKRVYFTTKMNELAKSMPPNIRFVKWTYSDVLSAEGESNVVMEMAGYVLSSDAGSELSVLNKLVAQLKENKNFMFGFSEIRIGRTSKDDLDGKTVTRFSLDCLKKKV